MDNETTLSFEEIVSVTNISDLIEIYSQRGIDFESEENFLEKLKNDWKSEVNRLEDSVNFMPIPKKLSSLDITLNDTTYSIFGVTHDFASGSKYRKLVSDAVNRKNNWLFEQGIGLFFKGENGAIEIPDESVNHFWNSFKTGLIIGIVLPLSIVFLAGRYLRPSKTAKEDLKELNVPPEARGDMPAYVKLEMKEKKRKPYALNQARSGYQAEFLRAYKPNEDKNFLVGVNHVPEIKHFLKNGVKESRIVDLAHNHAELLMNDPEKYCLISELTSVKAISELALGGVIGVSPYIACAYFLTR